MRGGVALVGDLESLGSVHLVIPGIELNLAAVETQRDCHNLGLNLELEFLLLVYDVRDSLVKHHFVPRLENELVPRGLGRWDNLLVLIGVILQLVDSVVDYPRADVLPQLIPHLENAALLGVDVDRPEIDHSGPNEDLLQLLAREVDLSVTRLGLGTRYGFVLFEEGLFVVGGLLEKLRVFEDQRLVLANRFEDIELVLLLGEFHLWLIKTRFHPKPEVRIKRRILNLLARGLIQLLPLVQEHRLQLLGLLA